MKGTVARNALGTVPPKAHVIALITYRDARGQQLPLPQSQMRESFTGLQLLTQQLLGDAGGLLSGWGQDFSIMQLGPSVFEIEIQAVAPSQSRQRGRTAMKNHLIALGLLDHLTDVLIDMGEAACFMAGHPEAELRYMDGYYGPYYEFVCDGQAVRAIEAHLLELLVAPDAVDGIRAVVANLKQPGVSYATIAKRVPSLSYMRRTQVPANDRLREFANGGPLPFTCESLEAARANAPAELSDRNAPSPHAPDAYAGWDE